MVYQEAHKLQIAAIFAMVPLSVLRVYHSMYYRRNAGCVIEELCAQRLQSEAVWGPFAMKQPLIKLKEKERCLH